MYQTMQQIYKWELWLYLKVGQPAIGELTCHYTRYPCHLAFALFRKGSLFWGLFWPFWALLGPYLYFRVPIFSVLLNSRVSIQCACTHQWLNLICAVLDHQLPFKMVSILAATGSVLHCFVSYLYLYVRFHKSSSWVPILAAGPYFIKVGSLFRSLEVPILKLWEQ